MAGEPRSPRSAVPLPPFAAWRSSQPGPLRCRSAGHIEERDRGGREGGSGGRLRWGTKRRKAGAPPSPWTSCSSAGDAPSLLCLTTIRRSAAAHHGGKRAKLSPRYLLLFRGGGRQGREWPGSSRRRRWREWVRWRRRW
jgi:hypothetical protein